MLCDALAEMNASWGAGPETMANIELLRDADCLAVVSGQQAGVVYRPALHDLQSTVGSETRRLLEPTKHEGGPGFLDCN